MLLGRRAQLVRQAPRVRPARPSNHSPLENRTHSASPALGTSTSAAGRVPQAPKGTSWDSAATSVQPRHSGSMTPSLGSAIGPRARTASTTTRPQTLNSPATATSAFEWRMARRVARGTSTSKALTTRAAPASRRPPRNRSSTDQQGRPTRARVGPPISAHLTASAHETLVCASVLSPDGGRRTPPPRARRRQWDTTSGGQPPPLRDNSLLGGRTQRMIPVCHPICHPAQSLSRPSGRAAKRPRPINEMVRVLGSRS